jgi:competence protein ComEC
LAVSGLHVGIIAVLIGFLLKAIFRTPELKFFRFGFLLSTLWFYAFLTGFSPSIIRATTMITLGIVTHLAGRKTYTFHILWLTGIIILILKPNELYQPGFQLSFAAVAGILAIQKPLQKINYIEPKTYFSKKIFLLSIAFVKSSLLISIAATLATLPFTWYYFRVFPVYFLITNLCIVPLATILVAGSIGVLVLKNLATWCTLPSEIWSWPGFVLNAVYDLVIGITNGISTLPMSQLKLPHLPVEGLWLLLFTLFLAFLAWQWKNSRIGIFTMLIFCLGSGWMLQSAYTLSNSQIIGTYDFGKRNNIYLIRDNQIFIYSESIKPSDSLYILNPHRELFYLKGYKVKNLKDLRNDFHKGNENFVNSTMVANPNKPQNNFYGYLRALMSQDLDRVKKVNFLNENQAVFYNFDENFVQKTN